MLINIIVFLVGLSGALLVSAGAWMIYPPAGLVAGGLLLMMISWMAARSVASAGGEGG
ncbi:hypothetical protein QJE18_002942 [Salmonella enterica]|nr:hypothetical protein [Salmonella enterica]